MSKVNFCLNGRPVTEQVILFKQSGKAEDFLPIMLYYENYKDHWFSQLEGYIDRSAFDSEFDLKLLYAINKFDAEFAQKNASKKGLSFQGNFNRWFYKILTNWKSNVKTSSFRVKKRPPVSCPICGRSVGRIEEEHLKHIKTVADLPRFMVWENDVYEVVATPRVYAATWGEKTPDKWDALNNDRLKEYASEKHRVRWPWRLPDGKRGVLCPFTKNIVPIIDDLYLASLPVKFRHYATPMTWEEFVSQHPTALIQSEIYSLDRCSMDAEDVSLRDYISDNRRIQNSEDHMDVAMIESGNIAIRYEHVFQSIDQCVEDPVDQRILKLVAAGYVMDDIAETLEISKKDLRKRLRSIRSCKQLEELLKR